MDPLPNASISALVADSRYARHLAGQMSGEDGETKRLRTRARLKLAALAWLVENGATDLTITSITCKAGVASGTFYTHFKDLREMIVEVLGELMEYEIHLASPIGRGETAFDAIRQGFREEMRIVRRFGKALRTIMELRTQDPDIMRMWGDVSDKWASQLGQAVRRSVGMTGIDDRYLKFLGAATSAMVDEIVFRLLLDKFETLNAIADDDDDIAELYAILRYRLLFAANPDPEELTVGKPLTRITLSAHRLRNPHEAEDD